MTDDALQDALTALLAIVEHGGAEGLCAARQAQALGAVLAPRIDWYARANGRCRLRLAELRALPAAGQIFSE